MFSSFPENFTYFLYNHPLEDVFILEYGYNNFEKVPPNYSKRYQHNYSIHLILEGEGTLNYNGQQYNLKKNDIFYLPPCDNFSYYPNPEAPWKYVWFLYNGKKVNELITFTNLSSLSPIIHLNDEISEKCKKLFYKLFIRSNKSNEYINLEATSTFFSFIATLMATNLQKEDSSIIDQQEKYNAILKLLRLNYSNHDLAIDSLLASMHISHSYACKIFKRFSNKSMQEHLIRIRMDAASALLQTTNLSIKNIANRVGYLDQLVFSRQFKKYFGCSPVHYRQSKNPQKN